MGHSWVNFARTGDPNGAGLPAWPAFAAASPKVFVFGKEAGVRPVPNLAQLEALDAYYAWRREQARKGER
jgi:para-nitrobenzyl esterase